MSVMVRQARMLREQWNGGDDGEKPRKTSHFRNYRDGSEAAVPSFDVNGRHSIEESRTGSTSAFIDRAKFNERTARSVRGRQLIE